jgi:hypothetical protein
VIVRLRSKMVMHRFAKPRTPVRFRPQPPSFDSTNPNKVHKLLILQHLMPFYCPMKHIGMY